MAIHESHSLKRTASQAQFDIPAAKKQYLGAVRHHKAKWNQQREYRQNAQLQNKVADDLLIRSIGLALEAVGFEGAEVGAIEAFRMEAEEYMARYLSDVRQAMLSSRRIQTIPQDFLQALHTNQLSLTSLLAHLDPPVSPSRSQFTLEKAALASNEEEHYRPINSLFAEASHGQSYIPKHFPHLPDRHTYQATPDFAQREQDPRKLRERAVEEGRLGEQALRKLVTAGTAGASRQQQDSKKEPSLREQRHRLWMDTMSAISQEQSNVLAQPGDMMGVEKEKGKEGEEGLERSSSFPHDHLSIAVNSEKKFWRKPPQGKGL